MVTTKRSAKKVRRSNARFARATPAQKRVLIAKDVISQLRPTGIYKATQCTYFTKLRGPRLSGQLQNSLKEIDSCAVCGVGALFCSAVRLYNKFEGRPPCGFGMVSFMEEEGLFSSGQSRLIEAAFEMNQMSAHEDNTESKVSWAIRFGCQYEDSNDRLVAIMRNIVKHRGTFVPGATA